MDEFSSMGGDVAGVLAGVLVDAGAVWGAAVALVLVSFAAVSLVKRL